MLNSRRLVLAHFWLGFAGFVAALLLGEWQMFIRSPLHAWLGYPEYYYRSVTAHGTAMAYVLPTLVAMGFGYFITEASLRRPLIGCRWAWLGFALVALGTVTAVVPVALGLASVLYTFYPPLIGNPAYYLGVVLVVLGSWIWVALMSVNVHRWKRDNPGAPVPLAMFANVAGSYLWAWTAVGAALELLFQVIPVSLGWWQTIDAGLARVFFSWTLHAIVYFWLMPTYIAYYTIVPRAIGGRLFSDPMGRLSFILFLVVAMPIGIHHLFADPQVGAGFKFLHAFFTALVALPTLLTVFTIAASVEIASRLRGGRGAFGWIRVLPWRNPIMLAAAFSFILLGFGGAGGLINMSYQLDAAVHNTQWITGHFHLIFGGAIVIMYFAIAYDIWPHLTGRALASYGLMRSQLWTWFVGMIVLSFPWHWVGLLGMPRRMSFYDYTDPAIAPQAVSVILSTIGGAILVVSGLLFLIILIRGRLAPPVDPGTVPLCRRRARAAAAAGRAQQLWALARPDGVPDRGQLRLSHRPPARDARHRRPRRLCGSAAVSASRQTTDRQRAIRSGAIGLTLGLAVLAAAVGFVLLPTVEGRPQLQGIWNAICTAAGVVRREPAQDIATTSARTTDVVVTQQIMPPASAQSIGNGATLALRCTMCHGARGLSEADSPNLAGQYATVVYKQLRDYKSGARTNAVMTSIAAALSDADMRDLAAYYAYLPRLPPDHPASAGLTPAIVATGAPMRNIAPCGACHGGPDSKAGSAWLEGQPEAYLAAQLHAFASGGRRNDINEQMRNIARRMTPEEIAAAARYYAQTQ